MSSLSSPAPGTTEAAAKKLVHELCAWAESLLDDPRSLEGCPELAADVLSTITAMGIIGNGGLRYWYEGMGCEDTLRAAVGFDRLGLSEQAEAMRASLTAFPIGITRTELWDYISAHGDELDARFESLDETIWNAEHALAAARYLSRRRADLLALEPRFRTVLDEFDRTNLKQ